MKAFGLIEIYGFTAMNCWQTAVQVTDIVDFCQTNLSKVHLHWDSFALLVFKNAGLGDRKNKYIN